MRTAYSRCESAAAQRLSACRPVMPFAWLAHLTLLTLAASCATPDISGIWYCSNEKPCANGYSCCANVCVKGACSDVDVPDQVSHEVDSDVLCVPNCSGRQCGDDGCGGSCGRCDSGWACVEQQCICVPNCSGRQCGDDGCGGSCGTCSAHYFCNADQQCEADPCEPDCNDKQCGSDGCGGSCGTCVPNDECNEQGQCVPICMPDCTNKECGDDGCGGSCGSCGVGEECDDGQCVSYLCDFAVGIGWQGAMEDGQCVHFFYPLPEEGNWTNVTSPPIEVPPGCGPPPSELPCNPSGPTFPWPPDTGESDCYDEMGIIGCLGTVGNSACASTALCGQDAQYGLDVRDPDWDEDRFEVSGSALEEIVTDTRTGLVWQKESEPSMSWGAAVDYCLQQAVSGFAGRNDWHLPNVFELQSVVNYGRSSPPSDFPGIGWEETWSSSSYQDDPGLAYQVQFAGGATILNDMSNTAAARCVILEPPTVPASARFYLNQSTFEEEPVVFDTRTGLLWQRATEEVEDWQTALAHCERLQYGGRADWRLPNVFELSTIVDYTHQDQNLTIDPLAFPSIPAEPSSSLLFWSSSPVVDASGAIWHLGFGDGGNSQAGMDGDAFVRCVTLGP